MSEFDLYWKTQAWATETHGDNAFVFVEIGSFMECYGTDDIGYAKRASKILNMRCPKRNNKKPLSKTNPYMLGFQTDMSFKNIPVLLDAGITIIWMSQFDVPYQKKKKREVTRIITAGTYVEHPTCDDEYNIAVICKSPETQKCEYTLAVLEGTIGKLEIMTMTTFDELVWFLNAYAPKEVLGVYLDDTEKKLIDYTKLVDITMKKQYTDPVYQHETLSQVYKDVENIDKEYWLAITLLFNHLWLCNKDMLKYIQFPKRMCESTMIFFNNAISQLDLLKSSKGCGLLNILDNTATPMGKRLLKKQLLKPWVQPQDIQVCYDQTEHYLSNMDITMKQHDIMNTSVPDLERILKRSITWENMAMLMDGYRTIHRHILPKNASLDEFLKSTDSIFEDVHEERVFPNVDEEYDRWSNKMKEIEHKTDELIRSWMKSKPEYYKLNKEYNERDGWRVITTPKKASELRVHHPELQVIKATKTSTKIETEELKQLFADLNEHTQRMHEAKSTMLQRIGNTLLERFGPMLEKASNQVAWIDTMISRCIFVKKHKRYIRPSIKVSSTDSWVSATNMRHPLLEEFDDCNGNSIYLNTDKPGILMYGVNGSGKSIYAKSIAINLIMAQAGFFVPADSFEYYPFSRMFTRINCDDDLYQNSSSFVMEMKELNTILRLSNKNSLVIGDELCKGTEDASAIGIVSAAIEFLLDTEVKFIFSSHLHILPQLTELKKRTKQEKLRIKHMQTTFENNEWVYKRTIADGPGDGIYGIEIAQHILQCPRLITKARQTRNHVMSHKNEMISTRKSRYTNEYEKPCTRCGSTKTIEHHHIEHQHEFEKQQTTIKNKKSNLMWLCKACHLEEHQKK